MSQAIEIVLFSGKPGVSADQMMAAARRADVRISAFPGFVSRSFGHTEGGRYVDIVHWADKGSALAASETVMACPVCAEFFALIDEGQMQMQHFEQG
jgi:hypothetical protein